jgi:hypothetical protein
LTRSVLALTKRNTIEGVGTATAVRRHALGRQLGIDDPQTPLFIDIQATELARLSQTHPLLPFVFMQSHHPEHRLRPIEANHRFAENLIPQPTHAGQQTVNEIAAELYRNR